MTHVPHGWLVLVMVGMILTSWSAYGCGDAAQNSLDQDRGPWRPGSDSAGFGDATEIHGEAIGLRAHFTEALGRHIHDPYALWYAERARSVGPNRTLGPLLALDWLGGSGRPSRCHMGRKMKQGLRKSFRCGD